MTTAQKTTTRRKLSHASPVVQLNRPASLLRGRRNGWEYASALVICGGVARRRGDFWWTRIVESRFDEDLLGRFAESVTGEKAAYVGGAPPGGEDRLAS